MIAPPDATLNRRPAARRAIVVYSTSYAGICYTSRGGARHTDGRTAAETISHARWYSDPDSLPARLRRGGAGNGNRRRSAQDGDGAGPGPGGGTRLHRPGESGGRR